MTVSRGEFLGENVSGKHETSENEYEKRDVNQVASYLNENMKRLLTRIPP